MQSFILPAIPLGRSHRPPVRMARWCLLVAFVWAADWLLYDRPIGVSLCVVLGLLALAAIIGNRPRATRREAAFAAAMLVLGLLPSIETAGALPSLFGVAGLAIFTLGMTGGLRASWPVAMRRAGVLMTANVSGRFRAATRRRRGRPATSSAAFVGLLRAWVIPATLGVVFAALFSSANPAFLSWVGLLDPRWILADLQPARPLFWAACGLAALAFVRVPAFGRAARAAPDGPRPAGNSWPGESLVLRSLVVVNLVFALQTGLDLVHLWGGAALPQGVTPAENAQKAAHILVVSALLAAGLVLLAGSGAAGRDAAPRRATTRILLHAWIAQNVVLVLSAMLRLAIYVDSYALTEMRIVAFLWMGVVAVGLLLIEWHLAFARTRSWLMGANLAVLAIALHGCALLDLKAIAADYNVGHSLELTGSGAPLDRDYLCALGGSALPAIEAFVERRRMVEAPGTEGWTAFGPGAERYLTACAGQIRATLARQTRDWRAWTFREHRLRGYIAGATDSSRRPDDAADHPGRR